MEKFPAQHPRDDQPDTQVADLFGGNSLHLARVGRQQAANHKPEGHQYAVGMDVERTEADEDGMHRRLLVFLVEDYAVLLKNGAIR